MTFTFTRLKQSQRWVVVGHGPAAASAKIGDTVMVQRRNKSPQAVILGKYLSQAVGDIDPDDVPERARDGYIHEIQDRLSDKQTQGFIDQQERDKSPGQQVDEVIDGIVDDIYGQDGGDGFAKVEQAARDAMARAEAKQKEQQASGGQPDALEARVREIAQEVFDASGMTEDAKAEFMQHIEQALDRDSAKIEKMLEEYEPPAPAPVTIEYVPVDESDLERPKVELDGSHRVLPDVIRDIKLGNHVYLVGPAGSGKTYLSQQVANALELDFYVVGALLTKYEVLGYLDANGQYHTTAMREAFEHGGLINIDEGDSCNPAALVAINAMLANDLYTFPDKTVTRHEDFRCIMCGNTIGQGADRMYVGRNPLDEASRDRFSFIEMNYDESLEAGIAHAEYKRFHGQDVDVVNEWLRIVRNARQKAEEARLRHVVSPRASMMGARFLADCGDKPDYSDAFTRYVLKGASDDVRAKLEYAA